MWIVPGGLEEHGGQPGGGQRGEERRKPGGGRRERAVWTQDSATQASCGQAHSWGREHGSASLQDKRDCAVEDCSLQVRKHRQEQAVGSVPMRAQIRPYGYA